MFWEILALKNRFHHLTLMAAFVVVPTILVQQLAVGADQLWWVYLCLLGGGFVAMVPAIIVAEKRNAQKPFHLCKYPQHLVQRQ